MAQLIDVLLLLALPASGKSEVRRYLARSLPSVATTISISPHGPARRLPYVHMMRRVSQELRKLGATGSSSTPTSCDEGAARLGDADRAPERGLRGPRAAPPAAPASASEWLLDRSTRPAPGRRRAGAGRLPADARAALVRALAKESSNLLRDKNAGIPESLDGRTVVIEFARGGPDGATLPLPAPLGYRYSLATSRTRSSRGRPSSTSG